MGTSRGKRHDIEHIGLHGAQTFRVNSFRGGQGTGDWGPGTGKDTTFYDPLLSTLWGQGGQDLDALEKACAGITKRCYDTHMRGAAAT